MVAVYNSETDFLSERIYYKSRIKADKLNMQELLIDLPSGEYAIAVFQDLNSDLVLNKSIFGFPLEPYGFSGNPNNLFRAPHWHETMLKIENDERIRITMD